MGTMVVLEYVGRDSQAACSYSYFQVLHCTLVETTATSNTLRFLILVSFHHAIISNPQSKKGITRGWTFGNKKIPWTCHHVMRVDLLETKI